MDKLLSLSYYLEARPNPDFQFTKLTFVLIALLLVLSFGLNFYRKKYVKEAVLKKLLRKYPSRFMYFALALLILLGFREAGLPYLSMRIWWVALFLYIIYWSVKVGVKFNKEYTERLSKASKKATINKYLPRKKKR